MHCAVNHCNAEIAGDDGGVDVTRYIGIDTCTAQGDGFGDVYCIERAAREGYDIAVGGSRVCIL